MPLAVKDGVEAPLAEVLERLLLPRPPLQTRVASEKRMRKRGEEKMFAAECVNGVVARARRSGGYIADVADVEEKGEAEEIYF